MSLSIRNSQVESLARDLAQRSGLTMTEVILKSLEETHEKLAQLPSKKFIVADLVKRFQNLPDLDKRSPEEILGYSGEGFFDNGR